MPTTKPELDPTTVADFRRRRHVTQFSLFGSILLDDFGPDRDVDVLGRFARGRASILSTRKVIHAA